MGELIMNNNIIILAIGLILGILLMGGLIMFKKSTEFNDARG